MRIERIIGYCVVNIQNDNHDNNNNNNNNNK